MIEVHAAQTPNGIKIPIALEEIGAPYRIVRVDLAAGDQKRPEFLKMNPNGRIPVIVDPDGPGGAPLTLFESGAILFYLAEKFGALLPPDPAGRMRALQWTFFQAAAVGPMFGQSGVFRRHAEPIPFALERYRAESQRLTLILDELLTASDFIAGDALSIADIAHFGWIDIGEQYAGIDLSEAPNLSRWRNALKARPAFLRAHAALK